MAAVPDLDQRSIPGFLERENGFNPPFNIFIPLGFFPSRRQSLTPKLSLKFFPLNRPRPLGTSPFVHSPAKIFPPELSEHLTHLDRPHFPVSPNLFSSKLFFLPLIAVEKSGPRRKVFLLQKVFDR